MVQSKTESNESTTSTAVGNASEIKITDIRMLEERIIGAHRIALFLGCSIRQVRRLAKRPDTPIYKAAGYNRLTALKSELDQWVRTPAYLSHG
jgi:hypothetical protein